MRTTYLPTHHSIHFRLSVHYSSICKEWKSSKKKKNLEGSHFINTDTKAQRDAAKAWNYCHKVESEVLLSEVQRCIPFVSPYFHSVDEDGGMEVLSRKPNLCGPYFEPGVSLNTEVPLLPHSSPDRYWPLLPKTHPLWEGTTDD